MPYDSGRRPAEGLSILTSRQNMQPERLLAKDEASRGVEPSQRASLTFTNGAKDTSLTLPLANTLFTNGRHSTLLKTTWTAENGGWVKLGSEEKNQQVIVALHDTQTLHSRIPAIPLTIGRRVVRCFGNIVRQIDLGTGSPEPASRELEVVMDQYLNTRDLAKENIAVWALIVPKEYGIDGSTLRPPSELLMDQDEVKAIWQRRRGDESYVRRFLDRGAVLCRVLSGGGGWGIKQGLLSLDPQTAYSAGGAENADMPDFPSLEYQQTIDGPQSAALKSLAHADDWIQFFVAESENGARGAVEPSKASITSSSNSGQGEVVFGTAPSTLDDASGNHLENCESDSLDYAVVTIEAGHFGALSECGIFLDLRTRLAESSQSEDGVTKTKIDLPFSYFYQNIECSIRHPHPLASPMAVHSSR